jgi:hypothetical protein
MMHSLKVGDFAGLVEQPMLSVPLPKLWYMLRVRPNSEITIERKLSDRGVSLYLPKEMRSVKTGWNRRLLRSFPVFEGALFIPDFEADLRRLKNVTNGIIGYIRFGQDAIRITPVIMGEIRKFEAWVSLSPSERKRWMAVDKQVRIKGGVLDMLVGRIASLDSHRRLTVLVDILGRMVPVELDEDQIEAI